MIRLFVELLFELLIRIISVPFMVVGLFLSGIGTVLCSLSYAIAHGISKGSVLYWESKVKNSAEMLEWVKERNRRVKRNADQP